MLNNIGIISPSDRAEHPIESATRTGRDYQVYESIENETYILARRNKAANTTVWYRADNYGDIERAIYTTDHAN